jgi:hypothetical protein
MSLQVIIISNAVAWAGNKRIALVMGNGFLSQVLSQVGAGIYLCLPCSGDLNRSYTDGSLSDLSKFSDQGTLSDFAVISHSDTGENGNCIGKRRSPGPCTQFDRGQMAKILCTGWGYNHGNLIYKNRE